MSKQELIQSVKNQLGDKQAADEDISLYISEGEKQLMNELNTTTLTSTLYLLVTGYAVQKLIENNYKYNSRVERRSGLDNYFKDRQATIDLYRGMLGQARRNAAIMKNNKGRRTDNKKREKGR